MTFQPSILAVIPARGGSKGMPRKNILPFNGKPLIVHSIEAALQSGVFSHTVVSTDDAEIAAVAKAAGAEVPFLRPPHLASDTAATLDVLRHALTACETDGQHFDAICCLQPTSPLRTVADIRGAVDLWLKQPDHAVYGVCSWEHPLAWSVTLDDDGHMAMKSFGKETDLRQGRQALAQDFRLNGAFYLWPRECLATLSAGLPAKVLAWTMPTDRSVDIDSKVDFDIAEFLARRSAQHPQGPA